MGDMEMPAITVAMCGAASPSQPPNEEVAGIVANVQEEAQNQLGRSFTEFKLVEYKSQVVAGTNYFCKVAVGGDEFVHLRIFKALPHTGKQPQVAKAVDKKTASDELQYFS